MNLRRKPKKKPKEGNKREDKDRMTLVKKSDNKEK